MNAQQNFPFAPSSVTQARHFVRARLDSLPVSIVETVLLIVSELATNAIRHASSGFNLEITLEDDEVHISIADSGGGEPAIASPQPTEPYGRGLRIVELLSDRWGIIPSTPERGKTVWFSVRVREPNRPLQDAK